MNRGSLGSLCSIYIRVVFNNVSSGRQQWPWVCQLNRGRMPRRKQIFVLSTDWFKESPWTAKCPFPIFHQALYSSGVAKSPFFQLFPTGQKGENGSWNRSHLQLCHQVSKASLSFSLLIHKIYFTRILWALVNIYEEFWSPCLMGIWCKLEIYKGPNPLALTIHHLLNYIHESGDNDFFRTIHSL